MSNVELELSGEKSRRDALLKAMSFEEKLNTLVDSDEINTYLMPELGRRIPEYLRDLRKRFFYALFFLFLAAVLMPGAVILYLYLWPLSSSVLGLILLGLGEVFATVLGLFAGINALIFLFAWLISFTKLNQDSFLFSAICVLVVESLGVLTLVLGFGLTLGTSFWTTCILSLATLYCSFFAVFILMQLECLPDNPNLAFALLTLLIAFLPVCLLLAPIFLMPAPISTMLIGFAMVFVFCVLLGIGGAYVLIQYEEKENASKQLLTELKKLAVPEIVREEQSEAKVEVKQAFSPLLARAIKKNYDARRENSWGEISTVPVVKFLLEQGADPKKPDPNLYLEDFQLKRAFRLGSQHPRIFSATERDPSLASWFFAELKNIYRWNLFKIDLKGEISIVKLVKEMGKGVVRSPLALEYWLECKRENTDAKELKKNTEEIVPQLDTFLIESWNENKELTASSEELMCLDYVSLKIFPQFQTTICKVLILPMSQKISDALPSIPLDLSKLICSFFFPGYTDAAMIESEESPRLLDQKSNEVSEAKKDRPDKEKDHPSNIEMVT